LPDHGNEHKSFHVYMCVYVYVYIYILLKLKHNILQQNLSFLRLNKRESTASDAKKMCAAILKGQMKSTGRKKKRGSYMGEICSVLIKSSPRSVILRLPTCGVNVFRAQLIKLNHKFPMQFVQVQL
jgi:hypothetical protein